MRICNKCGEGKSKDQYPIQRKGKKYESMSGYCRSCRKKQMYSNLNNDIDKFLADRHNRLIIRANTSKIPITITREEFLKLYHKQKGKCFYTNAEMIWGVGKGLNRNSLSIDRIIPEVGYTSENTVLCCNRINSIKQDMTLLELKEFIPKWYKKITEHFK